MNYRFLPLITLFFLASFQNFAQVEKHSSWSYSFSKKDVKVGDEIELILNVTIDEGWYVYSNDFNPKLGPLIAQFNFKPHSSYQLIDKTKSIKSKKKFDEIWEGEIGYFVHQGEFRQKIKVLEKDVVIIGSLEYQECSDVNGKCIQHEEDFSFPILKIATSNSNSHTAIVKEAKKDSILIPKKTEIISSVSTSVESSSSLWGFFLVAFSAGLAALLTPCVFPVIPMTVTFFIKESKSRKKAIAKALAYGLSIILIYTTVGTVIAKVNGPEFATWLSTHWAPNLFFFLVFVLFALSFFGMFEIILPGSFITKMDSLSEKRNLMGVFFMAFTLVLVSFSCTGPIVGSILVESSRGGFAKPIVGMFGFSLALALVFTLLAIFPEWLSKLPKSGGWLNTVKVVLGFLELALAFKFLSTADQVYHWHILDRDIFIVIWIAIFFVAGLYLLGIFRLPHDSEEKFVKVPRLILAICSFTFVFYLFPGLVGAPLKGLAGYLPPLSTQNFNLVSENSSQVKSESFLCDEHPLHSDFLKFPIPFQGYFDYEEGLACAKAKGKPVFLDFTGHSCTNCRQMEEKVWVHPDVMKKLQENFILISLYTDERRELPDSKWYTSTYDGKLKKTIGKQNTDFQITHFNNNAAPFYCILDENGKLLVPPRGYDVNIAGFVHFLDEGLKNFQNRQK